MPIPQGILDALNAAQAAKDTADQAVATKQQTAAALVQAQAGDQQAASDLAAKTAALDQSRKQLEAVLDSYLAPGAPPPS